MGIYNVASSKTEGIPSIRNVDNRVTGNIPVAYVVEKGVTVKVFGNSGGLEDGYLYNRGIKSNIFKGFSSVGTDNTYSYSEEDGYLAFTFPKATVIGGEFSSDYMDLSEYNTLHVEFEFVNASTGERLTSAAYPIQATLDNLAGKGYTVYVQANTTEFSLTIGNAYGGDFALSFSPMTGTAISNSDDVIMKIYSIYVTKE